MFLYPVSIQLVSIVLCGMRRQFGQANGKLTFEDKLILAIQSWQSERLLKNDKDTERIISLGSMPNQQNKKTVAQRWTSRLTLVVHNELSQLSFESSQFPVCEYHDLV